MSDRRWSDRRWFWQGDYADTSAGWAPTGIAAVLVVIGLLVYWINDMHMYGYGIFRMPDMSGMR